jgi:hypothetical protein
MADESGLQVHGASFATRILGAVCREVGDVAMRQKTYKIHWYGWECASAADVNSYTNSVGLVTCGTCLRHLRREKRFKDIAEYQAKKRRQNATPGGL